MLQPSQPFTTSGLLYPDISTNLMTVPVLSPMDPGMAQPAISEVTKALGTQQRSVTKVKPPESSNSGNAYKRRGTEAASNQLGSEDH